MPNEEPNPQVNQQPEVVSEAKKRLWYCEATLSNLINQLSPVNDLSHVTLKRLNGWNEDLRNVFAVLDVALKDKNVRMEDSRSRRDLRRTLSKAIASLQTAIQQYGLYEDNMSSSEDTSSPPPEPFNQCIRYCHECFFDLEPIMDLLKEIEA